MESRIAYTITKHASLGLTRALAMEHSATGVRINCICPGRTQTPFVEARLREYADPQDYLKQKALFGSLSHILFGNPACGATATQAGCVHPKLLRQAARAWA